MQEGWTSCDYFDIIKLANQVFRALPPEQYRVFRLHRHFRAGRSEELWLCIPVGSEAFAIYIQELAPDYPAKKIRRMLGLGS